MEEQNLSGKLNRRKFLRYSALGLTGLTILPSWVMADGIRIPPSDRVVLGFIGLGRQGMSDFNSFSYSPEYSLLQLATYTQSNVSVLKEE